MLDNLYARQPRTTDPEERRRLLRAFEKRLYEEVHFIHTFAWHRIVPPPEQGPRLVDHPEPLPEPAAPAE